MILNDDAPDPGRVGADLARARGLSLRNVYRFAFKGFAATIPPQAVELVRASPFVAAVVPDRELSAAGQIVPVGLSRVQVAPAAKNATARIDGVDGAVGAERGVADVAVLDSGIDQTHPDLNYAGGFNCYSGLPHPGGSTDPGVDEYGHGTHVAGTVGALDNGVGVVGVAPGARLWSVKVMDQFGGSSDSLLICGLEHVAANAGLYDAVNLSITGGRVDADDGNCGWTNFDPVHRAVCTAVGAGVTIVASAGNDVENAAQHYPAAYDEVITVSGMVDTDGRPGGVGSATSLGNDDAAYNSSNYGPDIDLAAPAVDILSTLPVGQGSYGTYTGTSMAAPHVTGAAALYLAAHPGTPPPQVRAVLRGGREKVHLPGDRDASDEGVLNLNDGAAWGAAGDETPPTGPVLTLTETEDDEYLRGTALFYNSTSGHRGSFTVAANTADPESGIGRVRFPDLFGEGGNDSSAPYTETYAWKEGAKTAGTMIVSAINGQGLTAEATFAVYPDRLDPTAAITSPAANAVLSGPTVVRVDAADPVGSNVPAGSGVRQVEVRYCPGATCNFGNGASLGIDATAPYDMAWSTLPTAGTYTLVARATDNVDNRHDSATVTVIVPQGVGTARTEPTATGADSRHGTPRHDRPGRHHRPKHGRGKDRPPAGTADEDGAVDMAARKERGK